MRLLLDSCLSRSAARELRDFGHDVERVGEWERDPGDAAILRRATGEGRALVTLDRDYGELAVLWTMRHAGIVRLVRVPTRRHGATVHVVAIRYEKDLGLGAIVTVEPGRVRVRSRPTDP